MLEDERHFARAHFEHGASAPAASSGIAETRIEEACIVHAELADERIERDHLGGVMRRHLHRLFRGQDVELVRVQNETLVFAPTDRLPEFSDVVAGAALNIDEAGMVLSAKADNCVIVWAVQSRRARG